MNPDEAQRRAEQILSERRFQESSYPRPLKGFFDWLADLVRPITGPIGRAIANLVEAIDRVVPGGRFIGWAMLAGLVLLGALLFGARLSKRKAGAMERLARIPSEQLGDDPKTLERAAEDAERGGDIEGAIRYRFRAGLIRLADAGAITWRPSLTSGQVRRTIRSRGFDDLCASFDAIAYGRRTPTASDLELARSGWPSVIREVEAR